MRPDEYKRQILQKAARYAEVFDTLNGKEILQDLNEKHVNVELFDTDPIKMAAKVARHDVVMEINNLVRAAHVHTEKSTT